MSVSLINARLQENFFNTLKAKALRCITLPSHAFFTPTELFWKHLISAVPPNTQLIECGAGLGTLIEPAKARGINLHACDLSYREGQHKDVSQIDALALRWSYRLWPFVCRPDHSGWCLDLALNALTQGACFIYVGLEKNFQQDVSEIPKHYRRSKRRGAVGEEGERMWVFYPNPYHKKEH